MNLRYGAGLTGGLLLALALVGASTVGQFAFQAAPDSGNYLSTTTQKSLTATTTGAGAVQASGNNTTVVPAPSSSTTTTQQSTAVPGGSRDQALGLVAFGSPKTPTASSLAALTTQGPSTDLLILLPLAVGALLGVLFYQASRSKGQEETDATEN